MISFLTQLKLDEISSVDKAANPDARILLMKRDGAAVTPEAALKISIASGLADDSIADKAAWIAEQTKAYDDHVAKGVVTFRKGATNVDRNTENLMMFAKMAIDQGRSPGLNKSVFIAGITLRADAIRKAGESAAQAFTRAITADEIGKTLYRASKVAPGPEIEPDGSSDYPASTAKTPPWVGLGPAHAKMQVLADDHLKANPRKSKEGAFAHVYSHPDNAALREQCKAEHFAAISKAMAA